jgi:GGDEF domain-containing protein
VKEERSGKAVLLVTENIVLKHIVHKLLSGSYKVGSCMNAHSAIEFAYDDIPSLIIYEVTDDYAVPPVVNALKNDPVFAPVPVLLVIDNDLAISDWSAFFADGYVRLDRVETELQALVNLVIQRAERVADVNPLTKLPGNIAVMKEIQGRLSACQLFATAWLDIDYFKPFNDTYGFARGDEVLRMLGRLILNTVRQKQKANSFIGHIGGDDFVYLTDLPFIEEVATDIISFFDRIIPTFYDPDDKARGCIEVVDRQGLKNLLPFMTVSIGITRNDIRPFTHYGEIASVAAEMKSLAKRTIGSCYKVDKRTSQILQQSLSHDEDVKVITNL